MARSWHRVLPHVPAQDRENTLPQQLGLRAVKVGSCHLGSPALCRKVPPRGLSLWVQGSLGFKLSVQHWAGRGSAAAACAEWGHRASSAWWLSVSPGVTVWRAKFRKTRPILTLRLCLQPAHRFPRGHREASSPSPRPHCPAGGRARAPLPAQLPEAPPRCSPPCGRPSPGSASAICPLPPALLRRGPSLS